MRTTFPKEYDGASLPAQIPHNLTPVRTSDIKFPVTVKHRHVKVKIYKKSAKYSYYRIAYKVEGRRVVRNFKTYGAAKQEADRIARQIAKGNEAAAALTTKDALAYKFAWTKLAELTATLNARKVDLSVPDLVLSLEDAITEYVEAKRAFGPRRLIEAVQAFQSTVARVHRVSVRKAADEYLTERGQLAKPREPGKRPQLSPKMVYQERLRLDRFANNFEGDVCDLTKDHVDLFFAKHIGSLAPRSRNHYRGTLRLFFRFCMAHDYLPANHRLDDSTGLSPGGRKKERNETGDIEIYKPKEFADLLAHADRQLQVLIAIGGLAGLRTQELLRLEWADVWRRAGYIEVGKTKAKTRQRRLVPICAALSAWLAPWKEFRDGLIWTGHEVTFHEHMRNLATKAKVRRKDNALRHSFISCRFEETHHEHQVAQEAGTSPAMIHAHYRALVTQAEAKEWFNVLPLESANNNVELRRLSEARSM
jgi:integrase